jgi:hypothetical protein
MDYRMFHLGTLALSLEHMYSKHGSLLEAVELLSILTYSAGLSDLHGTAQLHNIELQEQCSIILMLSVLSHSEQVYATHE